MSLDGVPDDLDHVVAGRERLPGGVAARETEGIPARQHVAQPGEQADACAVCAPQVDVAERELPQLGSPAAARASCVLAAIVARPSLVGRSGGVNGALPRQPAPVERPSASVAGDAAISPATAAPTSMAPAPCEVMGSASTGCAVPTRRL